MRELLSHVPVNLDEDFQRAIFKATLDSEWPYKPSPEYAVMFAKLILDQAQMTRQPLYEPLFNEYLEKSTGRRPGAPENIFLADILVYTTHRTYVLPGKNLDASQIVILENANAFASESSTGLVTWAAAMFLVEYLATQKADFVRKSSILELGSGSGFVGLSCAAIGARKVHLTDKQGPALERLRENIDINTPFLKIRVSASCLDWFDEIGSHFLGIFDLVIASDVLYSPDLIPSLCKLLRDFLNCGLRKTVYIASCIRNRVTYNDFISKMSGHGVYVSEIHQGAELSWFFEPDVTDRHFSILEVLLSNKPTSERVHVEKPLLPAGMNTPLYPQ